MYLRELFTERLTEGLKSSPVDYGTNPERNNKRIQHNASYASTFFLKDGRAYMVGITRSGVIGFGANKTEDQSNNFYGSYDDERIDTVSALRVFNHVIFIIKELVQEVRPNFLRLEGKGPKLKAIYDRAVRSSSIKAELEVLGYTYAGEYQGEHIFQKVIN